MIEEKIKDYLISKIESLTSSNCLLGEAGEEQQTPYALVKSTLSPLTDTHNAITEKLSTPKGIDQNVEALCVEVIDTSYSSGAVLIWDIFDELGGPDGGLVVQDGTKIYITPNENPYHESNYKFILNFVARYTD